MAYAYENQTAHHVHAGAEAGEEQDLVCGNHPLAAGLNIKSQHLALERFRVHISLLSKPCSSSVSESHALSVLLPSVLPSSSQQRTFSHVLKPSCFWNSRW